MPEIDENTKLQRITKFLEMGGTMLAASHDCGAPMFRYQGKTFCPVCDVGEEKKAAREAGTPRQETTGQELVKRPVKKEISLPVEQDEDIGATIRNKIQNIASSLESETDLQRIREKLECIELGMRILRSMNHMR